MSPEKLLATLNQFFFLNEEADTGMNLLFLGLKAGVSVYVFHKLLQSKHELDYKSPYASALARACKFILLLFATKERDEKIDTTNGPVILAVGQHKTSWEAFALGTHVKGKPPRFLASNYFSKIPLVAQLLVWFETINVNHGSANHKLNDNVKAALDAGDCVAIFPDGEFGRIGKLPPFIHSGAARFALDNQVPIKVVRLDGLWSLNNPLIPVFIRNSLAWRFIFSLFHGNNVRATQCCEIQIPQQAFKPEEKKEKINIINAILYSYFCHGQDLSPFQIDFITQLSLDDKLALWDSRKALKACEQSLKLSENSENKQNFSETKAALYAHHQRLFQPMEKLSGKSPHNLLTSLPVFNIEHESSELAAVSDGGHQMSSTL